jgi:phosphomethylpyrimidine synthase
LNHRYGADTLMDLSTGGDLDYVRRLIEKSRGAPFGTVPTYQAWIEGVRRYGSVASTPPDWSLEVVERHLRDGVGFVTTHAAVAGGACL